MKNPIKLFLAFFATFISGQAQTIVLTGHVTSVAGTYTGEFSSNDAVRLSLDFNGHLDDLFHHAYPGEALYPATATLTIDGRNLSLGTSGGLAVGFLNLPLRDGIQVYDFWQDWGGEYTPVEPYSDRELIFALISKNDVLHSILEFPSGIPMSNFDPTGQMGTFFFNTGHYARVSHDLENDLTGRIDWVFTGYTGFSANPDTPPLSAVPESPIYGMVAALSLGGFIARKRMRKNNANTITA